MAETETRPAKKSTARKDSVKPPESLPDAPPFERMLEFARRLLAVPKSEIPAKPKRRNRRH